MSTWYRYVVSFISFCHGCQTIYKHNNHAQRRLFILFGFICYLSQNGKIIIRKLHNSDKKTNVSGDDDGDGETINGFVDELNGWWFSPMYLCLYLRTIRLDWVSKLCWNQIKRNVVWTKIIIKIVKRRRTANLLYEDDERCAVTTIQRCYRS